MWDNISVDKCESFIKSHFHPKGEATLEAPAKPAITIARQEGAGGLTVASNLADYLQAHTPSRETWTVFSQQLVAKVLEEHRLHERVGDFMKEGHKAMLFDAVEEWMGLHPSSWTLVEKTNATILRLAQIGNVILVGRGANIVTRELQTVFHVYLVASLEKRIERAQKVFTLDRKAAVSYIKKKDEARRRYLKDNFDKDINDPLLYHITINTDLVQHQDAAQLIGEEVIRRFQLNRRVRAVAD